MRARHLWILLALLLTTSCGSYEELKKVETAVTKSVEEFHEQLNNEQFHEIYVQASQSLRQRIDEPTFTNQLRNAHEQLGTVSGKEMVLLTAKAWNDLQWNRFFGREQIVFCRSLAKSELINADERFEWKLEDDKPKLHSYEFRFVCKKPCTVGFGVGP